MIPHDRRMKFRSVAAFLFGDFRTGQTFDDIANRVQEILKVFIRKDIGKRVVYPLGGFFHFIRGYDDLFAVDDDDL